LLLTSHSFLLAVQLTAAATVLVGVVLLRPGRRALVRAGLVAAPVMAGAIAYLRLVDPFHSHFPTSFFVWGASPVVAAAIAGTAWRRRRLGARLLSVLPVLGCGAFAAATINAHYGYFPDLRSLTGKVAAHQVSRARVAKVARVAETTGRLPANGYTFSLMVPNPRSRFHARGTFVYLPPAWFATPRPTLPALMLIAGSPGTPADWTRSARADEIADSFARAHHGLAPILVMPDPNGGPFADTECVDGPRGAADTFLSEDVRNFVITRYNAGARAVDWAIAGLSEGGTCALTLSLRHPDKFAFAGDFGGEIAPTVGKGTLRSIFGGSHQLMASYDPLSLIAQHDSPGAAVWLEVGLGDRGPRAAARRLAPRLAAAQVQTCIVERTGQHNFGFWHTTLEHSLPWFAARLGLTTEDPARRCALAAGRVVRPGSNPPTTPPRSPVTRTRMFVSSTGR
jgi:S-formylglutathione hydrolase FrmB